MSSRPVAVAGPSTSRRLSRLVKAFTAAWLILSAMPTGSGAAVLEGPHVLFLTAAAMGKLRSLQVTQQVTLSSPLPETASSTFEETAVYVMPRRFRSDRATAQHRKTFLEVGTRSLSIVNGRIASTTNRLDTYQRLLRSRTQPQLMRTINRLGVETAIVSLGRIEETIVYVLGARYPDETVSQLAIDKETFFPLRLHLVDTEPDSPTRVVDIFYRDWRPINKAWFPFQVTGTVDGQPSREIRVTAFVPDPVIPEGKMDLEALQASIAQEQIETPQVEKQEAWEEIQRGVQDFQKKFE